MTTVLYIDGVHRLTQTAPTLELLCNAVGLFALSASIQRVIRHTVAEGGQCASKLALQKCTDSCSQHGQR